MFSKIIKLFCLIFSCLFYEKLFKTKFNEKLIRYLINNHCDIIVLKFIQWFSMRPDLISKDLYNIFNTYKDNCPCHPIEYSKQVIKEYNNIQLGDVIASASIAQVYKGYDMDTQELCAVKIKHPNLLSNSNTYKIYIVYLIRLLKMVGLRINMDLENFYNGIVNQINMSLEAQNAIKYYNYYHACNGIIIPETLNYNEDLIIYSYEESQKFEDFCKKQMDTNFQKNIIINFLTLFYGNIILNNSFHADIHDSNWGCRNNGDIVLYDFGFIRTIQSDTILKMLKTATVNDSFSILYVLMSSDQENFGKNLDKIKNKNYKKFKLEERCHENLGNVKVILDLFYELNIYIDSSLLNFLINVIILDKYYTRYNIEYNENGEFYRPQIFKHLIDGTNRTYSGTEKEKLINTYTDLDN